MKPEELKYTKNHLWVRVDGDTVTAGLSDYAQQELGDIVFVELPEIGKKVEREDPIGTVESVKSVSDFFSPLSGEIVDTNRLLEDKPDTINKDPYGEGWIIKIRIEKRGELKDLLAYSAYNEFTQSEE